MFAIREIEMDFKDVASASSCISFSNMLSVIALIVAIAVGLPNFRFLLEEGSSASLFTCIALSAAILTFTAILFGQSFGQLIQRGKRTKTSKELQEAHDALSAFLISRETTHQSACDD